MAQIYFTAINQSGALNLPDEPITCVEWTQSTNQMCEVVEVKQVKSDTSILDLDVAKI